jgi:hypothetical protein
LVKIVSERIEPRMEFLPYVVPIVGTAVIFSVSVSCCFYRWNRRQIENLEDRVGGLERRAAVTPLLPSTVTQIPTVTYPPPIAVALSGPLNGPPPYRPIPGMPMATAPPPYRPGV